MKNETARREIESLDYYLQNHTDDYSEESHTAMMMAVKVLEQQPCEDAISRQAVLDIVNNPLNIRLDEIIKKLPPVTPQSKTGHWIYYNYNWRCSKCNETPKTLGYVGTADFMTEHFKFCNHCGARMIESQQSEDLGDYPDTIHNQFDNMTGSMNL